MFRLSPLHGPLPHLLLTRAFFPRASGAQM
jgi:hypothetical protein